MLTWKKWIGLFLLLIAIITISIAIWGYCNVTNFIRTWPWLFQSLFTAIFATFFAWLLDRQRKKHIQTTAVSSIILELTVNYMVLVQESKLIRKAGQYPFRLFVRSDSWQEIKASIRESLDAKLFNTIDRSYFVLYQIEIGLQRLSDYKECNEQNMPKALIEIAKELMLDSIKQLNKFAKMDKVITEFDAWRMDNDHT